jgi:hypothetical protein
MTGAGGRGVGIKYGGMTDKKSGPAILTAVEMEGKFTAKQRSR